MKQILGACWYILKRVAIVSVLTVAIGVWTIGCGYLFATHPLWLFVIAFVIGVVARLLWVQCQRSKGR